MQKWVGRVWLNPPYGTQTATWLAKMVLHGNGIALIFARTETKMFFNYVWGEADALFFFKGRLKFYHSNGTKGGTAGAPSVLIAYGDNNARILKNCHLKGEYIQLQ